MAAAKQQVRQVVHDPNVWVGPYRILKRTDGKWIVFEPGRPPGQGTVSGPHGDQGVAERAAKRLVEAAAPDAAEREWKESETWEPKDDRKPEGWTG